MNAPREELLGGVDGGGTRTRAVVCVEDRVLGRAEAGPSNPLSVGVETAAAAIAEAMHAALSAAGRGAPDLGACGLAVAGIGGSKAHRDALRAAVQLALDGREVTMFTDVEAALAGAFGGAPGILLAGGTGSVALGFDGERVASAGGWGRRLGDPGSGYAILRAAAIAALGARDGLTAGATGLGVALIDGLGLADVADLMVLFARDPRPDELVRGVEAVTLAERRGDPVARAILDDAGRDLARFSLAVAGRLGGPAPLPVAAVGGVAGSAGRVRDRLVESLRGAGHTVVAPAEPADLGAARLASGAPALAELLAALEQAP